MRRLQWYKRGAAYILLWDFHDTSCKFIRKVSFLYITIYQVNTILFSLKMRLWDFFLKKKTITQENSIIVILAIVLEWNTNKEDGDCKSPGGSGRTFFWQRIANPLERLAEDFLIENQPERLTGDFLIENQPERLAGDFLIENQPERLAGDFQIENQSERLAGDFLIVRRTNNATPKRAVFWFKSTITTI